VEGVRAAAAGNLLPAIDANARRAIEVAGQRIAEQSKWPRVDFRAVSAHYFDVLRLPMMSGRAFTPMDQPASEPVAIVSESMARKFWPSGHAIGERVRTPSGAWLRIVGICGDVVHDLFDGRTPTLYLPMTQAPAEALVFAVRTAGDPLASVDGARRRSRRWMRPSRCSRSRACARS